MSKVITFSRFFQSNHPRKGEPTYFAEKLLASLDGKYSLNDSSVDKYYEAYPDWHNHNPKHHTIRAGHKWKVGDYFSPRV
jgi:hypothetical protein